LKSLKLRYKAEIFRPAGSLLGANESFQRQYPNGMSVQLSFLGIGSDPLLISKSGHLSK
jgi:hypothetical protein